MRWESDGDEREDVVDVIGAIKEAGAKLGENLEAQMLFSLPRQSSLPFYISQSRGRRVAT